jgi:hypothetical protein
MIQDLIIKRALKPDVFISTLLAPDKDLLPLKFYSMHTVL